MVGFILNIPYTIIGLLMGLVSVPIDIAWRRNPHAVIFNVKSFWWTTGYMKNVRAVTIGQVIVLGPRTEAKDLEHELIHIEQNQRVPLVQPVLYCVELIRKGYADNKYEIEAYRRAQNIYRGK